MRKYQSASQQRRSKRKRDEGRLQEMLCPTVTELGGLENTSSCVVYEGNSKDGSAR